MHQKTPIFQAILAVDEMISVEADTSCSRSSSGDHVVLGAVLKIFLERKRGFGKMTVFRGGGGGFH